MAQPQLQSQLQSRTFGRRGSSPPPRAAPPVARAAKAPDEASDPALEAFRASLRSSPADASLTEDQAFDAWLRGQRMRRWRLVGVRLAFLAPGLVCLVLQTPWHISLGLEAAGVLANRWVKVERKRQAGEITAWSADADEKCR